MKRFHDLYWDDENISHIQRHRVAPNEAEQVIFSSSSRIRRGRGQKIYYILGQTEAGRFLFIVLKVWRGGVGRVVTARDMTDKERRWYKE